MKERKWSRVFMIFSPVYIFIGMHSVSNYLLNILDVVCIPLELQQREIKEKILKRPQGGPNIMKKNIVLIVLIAIMAMILGACNTAPVVWIPSYKDGMKAQCFALGGLLDKDANCVLVAQAQPAPVQAEMFGMSDKVVVSFGPEIGSFHFTPNEVYGRWEVNWDERYRTSQGKPCTQVTEEGAKGSFFMPADGMVNSVNGDIFVNGEKWRNGNPILSPTTSSNIVPSGAKVDFVFYGNVSDCLSLWIPYN